jgi:hypothetical protein
MKKLLLGALFINLTSLFVTAQTVTFADANFETQFRNQVENGWIYIPNYTGSNYQFSASDLNDTTYLYIDEDGPQVSSLSDLQYFPKLRSLTIPDASKISDFSPVWSLKDTLEYLTINGARSSANLSGASDLSKLRSLDLDDNQLTNLNFIGSFPQLTSIYLVGNHLDLSDASIRATLSNLRTLVQTNRSNQGWWWYSEAVEVEPQIPKSFQNLSAEIFRVQNGNDPESNLLKGIHGLLDILESTEANSLKQFVMALGVDSSIQQFTLSELPMLENYDFSLNRDFSSGKLAELFQDSIIPSLEQIDSDFAKIPTGSVISLSQELTGTEEVVTVDYADVLVLRSIVNLLSTFASMQSGYNWNLNAGFLDDFNDDTEITAEVLRVHNSSFGSIRDASQLGKAKQFLESAISLYGQASPLLRETSRLDTSMINGQPGPDRLFVLSSQDFYEEREFRDALEELSKAINGTYDLKDDDWGLNKLLVSGGVPSSSKTFTIEAVNGSANREITIKLLTWYWGWGGSELIIRDAASKIVYNGTLSGGGQSSEIISLPANQSYTVEVSEGPNYWSSYSKFWEIRYYDSVLQSTDDDIIAESETIDLSQFFAGKLDLASLLPASVGNNFTTDEVTDPTFGGLLPNWTQRRVSEEMQADGLVPLKYEIQVTVEAGGTVTGAGIYSEGASVTLNAVANEGYKFSGWQGSIEGADLLNSRLSFTVTESIQEKAIFEENPLWNDPRSYVFWRYERLGDDSVNVNYSNKESLILKSLSDGSEEVLYSINSQDLTEELSLGSSGASSNGLWIDESKVHVSQDGSTIISGYALLYSMAGMSDNRYLVRIISYDMTTRQASVIREWKGSNLGATTNIEYVDFCIEALTVDWDAGLAYFTEERHSSNMGYNEPSTVRLVACNLDGSGLKAIREFDAKTTTGSASSYSAEIEQIHVGSSDGTIRVMVSYGNRNMGSYSEEILSFKADGTEASLTIENEGIGYDSTTSSVSESFEPFSLTSDGSKILFAKYYGGNSAIGEPGKVSLLSLTKEGYDKLVYWNYDSNQLGSWNPAEGRINPRITATSDEKNGKITLVLEDQGTLADSLNNLKEAELVELDVATGTAVTLVRGRQTLDYQGMGQYTLRDDLDTGFLFSSGTTEPPNESTKDTDGDGLPDEVEIGAGMDPDKNDSQIVNAVFNYFFEKGGFVVKDLVAATPHTYQWYYQPEWGWIWTNEKVFPFIYRAPVDGQAGGWLYFSKKSANPVRFYDYSVENWITLGE